jgi:hypothetical protein
VKWEYAVHVADWTFPTVVQVLLNRLGAEGWEVFHVGTVSHSNSAYIYAKRVLPEEAASVG